jgi:hypothetical protein
MPTQHRRIAVTEDPELASALRAVAPLVDADTKPARLVRDLALRGAEALLEERRRRDAAIEQLIAWSTSPETGDEILRARDEAWQ